MSAVLDQLHNDLSDDLDRVTRRFNPGVKVTFVIRRPDDIEADVVIGDDDLNEAIATIQRRIGASPHAAKPPCRDMSPPWFTGRWRDWHRGHGCDKDDGKPRTAEGQAEIERGAMRIRADENEAARCGDPSVWKGCARAAGHDGGHSTYDIDAIAKAKEGGRG